MPFCDLPHITVHSLQWTMLVMSVVSMSLGYADEGSCSSLPHDEYKDCVQHRNIEIGLLAFGLYQ